MDAGLRVRIALHTDRLARPFARAGICLRSLTAHRQTTQMPDTAIAFDTLKALQIHAELAAQIAFDHVLTLLDRMHNLGHLLLVQIFCTDSRIKTSLGNDCLSIDRPDSVNVSERDIDPLLAWNINT